VFKPWELMCRLFLCAVLRYYVLNDFTLHCYDHNWYKYLPVAIIMTFVYPIVRALLVLLLLLM